MTEFTILSTPTLPQEESSFTFTGTIDEGVTLLQRLYGVATAPGTQDPQDQRVSDIVNRVVPNGKRIRFLVTYQVTAIEDMPT